MLSVFVRLHSLGFKNYISVKSSQCLLKYTFLNLYIFKQYRFYLNKFEIEQYIDVSYTQDIDYRFQNE